MRAHSSTRIRTCIFLFGRFARRLRQTECRAASGFKHMFLVGKPSMPAIENFLSRRQNQRFSYREVGSTNGVLPRDYTIDRNEVTLGTGSAVFERAAASLRAW